MSVQGYIDARASQYSSDPRLGTLIEQATLETSSRAYGNLTDKAIALLVLHWLAVDDRSGTSKDGGVVGTLKREREGSLEKEYMIDFAVTSRDPDLSQSKWGLELRQLRKSCVFAPMTRMSEVYG